MVTGEEANFRLRPKEWHRRTGYFERKSKLNAYTGDFERKCKKLRGDREIFPEMPSPKSHEHITYLEYQLLVFNKSREVINVIYNKLFYDSIHFCSFMRSHRMKYMPSAVASHETHGKCGHTE